MWHPIHRRSSDQLHNNNLVSIYRRIRLVFPAKFTQSPGQNLKAKFTNFFTKYQKLYPYTLEPALPRVKWKALIKVFLVLVVTKQHSLFFRHSLELIELSSIN
jgi:hypothetical protein